MKENLAFNLNRLYVGIVLLFFITIFYMVNFDTLLLLIIILFIFYDIYYSKLINNNFLITSLIFILINIFFYHVFKSFIPYLILIQFISILIILFFKTYIRISFLINLICFILLFSHLLIIDRNVFYLIIFLSFLNDTSAYIFGRLIKGPLIIPNISPKKTWSGTVFSFLISLSSLLFFNFNLVMSILISLSFFLGDILFSIVKRNLKIKDFSNMLKDHGGSLDRLDSILLPIFIINLNMLI